MAPTKKKQSFNGEHRSEQCISSFAETQEYKIESPDSDQDSQDVGQIDIKSEAESESDYETTGSSEESQMLDNSNSVNQGLILPVKQEHSVFRRITEETSNRRKNAVPAYKTSRADETVIINPVLSIDPPPFNQTLVRGAETASSVQGSQLQANQCLSLPVKQEASLTSQPGSTSTSRRQMLPPAYQTSRAYRKILLNPIPQIGTQQVDQTPLPWYDKSMQAEPSKKFSCEKCGKSFSGPGILKRHLNTHKGGQLHVCKVCGKSFIQNISLEVHSLSHMGDNPHACRYCGKSFKYKFELDVHIQHHSGSPILKGAHTCQKCGQTFPNSKDLESHKHTHMERDSSTFPCDVCGKAFRVRASLTRHALTHKDEFPFACKTCGKMFKDNGELQEHKRSHYTGKRSHACEVCGRSFAQKCSLRSHMLIHVNDRPHQCGICGQSFPMMHSLDEHMRNHVDDS